MLALEKCSYCGVKLLATAHAENVDELRRRRLYQILLETGVFRRALCCGKISHLLKRRSDYDKTTWDGYDPVSSARRV